MSAKTAPTQTEMLQQTSHLCSISCKVSCYIHSSIENLCPPERYLPAPTPQKEFSKQHPREQAPAYLPLGWPRTHHLIADLCPYFVHYYECGHAFLWIAKQERPSGVHSTICTWIIFLLRRHQEEMGKTALSLCRRCWQLKKVCVLLKVREFLKHWKWRVSKWKGISLVVGRGMKKLWS